MGILDFFTDSVGPDSSFSSFILAEFATILILVGVGALIFAIIRIYINYTKYAGTGERLGKYKFTIMNLYPITGNLNVNDVFFKTDELELLLEQKEISGGIKHILDLVKRGKLWAYDFRSTDHDDAFDLRGSGKNILIISPSRIQSDDFSWQNQKGEFSIVASGFKEYPRNVICWVTSEHHQFRNQDRKIIDAYVISPIPKGLGRKMIKEPMEKRELTPLILEKLEGAKELATAAAYIPTLSETWRQITIRKQENETLRELLHRKDQSLSAKNARLNMARELLNQKILVGYGKPVTPFERGLDLVWVVGGVIMGAFGYSMQDFIPQLAGKVTPWMGVGIMMIIMIALRHLSQRKKPYEEGEITKEHQQGEYSV